MSRTLDNTLARVQDKKKHQKFREELEQEFVGRDVQQKGKEPFYEQAVFLTVHLDGITVGQPKAVAPSTSTVLYSEEKRSVKSGEYSTTLQNQYDTYMGVLCQKAYKPRKKILGGGTTLTTGEFTTGLLAVYQIEQQVYSLFEGKLDAVIEEQKIRHFPEDLRMLERRVVLTQQDVDTARVKEGAKDQVAIFFSSEVAISGKDLDLSQTTFKGYREQDKVLKISGENLKLPYIADNTELLLKVTNSALVGKPGMNKVTLEDQSKISGQGSVVSGIHFSVNGSVVMDEALLHSDVTFQGELDNASFEDTRAVEVKFQGMTLDSCSFNRADLQKASFSGSVVQGIKVDEAKLSGLDLRGAVVASVHFSRMCGTQESDQVTGVNWNDAKSYRFCYFDKRGEFYQSGLDKVVLDTCYFELSLSGGSRSHLQGTQFGYFDRCSIYAGQLDDKTRIGVGGKAVVGPNMMHVTGMSSDVFGEAGRVTNVIAIGVDSEVVQGLKSKNKDTLVIGTAEELVAALVRGDFHQQRVNMNHLQIKGKDLDLQKLKNLGVSCQFDKDRLVIAPQNGQGDLGNTILTNCLFQDVAFYGYQMPDMSGARLENVKFEKCQLTSLYGLRGVQGKHSYATMECVGCDMVRLNMRDACVERSCFFNSETRGMRFDRNTIIRKSRFEACIDLDEAILGSRKRGHGTLDRCKFPGSSLPVNKRECLGIYKNCDFSDVTSVLTIGALYEWGTKKEQISGDIGHKTVKGTAPIKDTTGNERAITYYLDIRATFMKVQSDQVPIVIEINDAISGEFKNQLSSAWNSFLASKDLRKKKHDTRLDYVELVNDCLLGESREALDHLKAHGADSRRYQANSRSPKTFTNITKDTKLARALKTQAAVFDTALPRYMHQYTDQIKKGWGHLECPVTKEYQNRSKLCIGRDDQLDRREIETRAGRQQFIENIIETLYMQELGMIKDMINEARNGSLPQLNSEASDLVRTAHGIISLSIELSRKEKKEKQPKDKEVKEKKDKDKDKKSKKLREKEAEEVEKIKEKKEKKKKEKKEKSSKSEPRIADIESDVSEEYVAEDGESTTSPDVSTASTDDSEAIRRREERERITKTVDEYYTQIVLPNSKIENAEERFKAFDDEKKKLEKETAGNPVDQAILDAKRTYAYNMHDAVIQQWFGGLKEEIGQVDLQIKRAELEKAEKIREIEKLQASEQTLSALFVNLNQWFFDVSVLLKNGKVTAAELKSHQVEGKPTEIIKHVNTYHDLMAGRGDSAERSKLLEAVADYLLGDNVALPQEQKNMLEAVFKVRCAFAKELSESTASLQRKGLKGETELNEGRSFNDALLFLRDNFPLVEATSGGGKGVAAEQAVKQSLQAVADYSRIPADASGSYYGLLKDCLHGQLVFFGLAQRKEAALKGSGGYGQTKIRYGGGSGAIKDNEYGGFPVPAATAEAMNDISEEYLVRRAGLGDLRATSQACEEKQKQLQALKLEKVKELRHAVTVVSGNKVEDEKPKEAETEKPKEPGFVNLVKKREDLAVAAEDGITVRTEFKLPPAMAKLTITLEGVNKQDACLAKAKEFVAKFSEEGLATQIKLLKEPTASASIIKLEFKPDQLGVKKYKDLDEVGRKAFWNDKIEKITGKAPPQQQL